MGHQRLVGGRHRVVPQAVWAHPRQLLAFQRRHRSLPTPADVERHQKMEIRIAVAGEGERREARFVDDDPQLFPEFPHQGVLGPLPRLDLAAGKFPQAGHRPACRPLRDQHAAVRIHEGASGDEDEFDAHEVTDRRWKSQGFKDVRRDERCRFHSASECRLTANDIVRQSRQER